MLENKNLERREKRRLYCTIPLACGIIDPQTKNVINKNYMTQDISSSGLYFETSEPLSLQTELDCRFTLPESDITINSVIRVERVMLIDEGKSFGIGAVFLTIAEKDREAINQLVDRFDINGLLELTVKRSASDLHLLANQAAVLRVNGQLESLDAGIFSPDEISKMVYSLMSKLQIRTFEKHKELDFGFQYNSENRFRINVHQQKGFIEATLRLISSKAPTFEDLNIPEVVKSFARQKDGLVLVTGPTGSGKSTTIGAMVDLINNERKAVIITLERPIEYIHISNKCVIKQREVGTDTNSFSEALKSSLRQDPNVIVVGEMDDAETVKTALIAAEAGYLVIASFHAPDTIQAIDRLVSIFPSENRKQVLAQFSHCLKGIVTQLLIPRSDKKGRILATEILVTNDAVKRVIRNDELIQLPSIIQTGSNYKMKTFKESIKQYFEQGVIDGEAYEWFSRGNY
ncbi:MAG: PilT/PilU family type 4a pilus ATPase [Candidatus Omnitrophota bacterium]